MASYHYDFIFELRIGSGNLRDGVEAMFVVTCESGFNVEFNVYGNVRLEKAIHASVVLNRHYRAGHRTGMIAAVNKPAEGRASVVKQSATGAPVVASVAAGHDHGDCFLICKELPNLFPEFQAPEKLLESVVAFAL